MRDVPGDGDVDLDSIVREIAEMECKSAPNFREWNEGFRWIAEPAHLTANFQ